MHTEKKWGPHVAIILDNGSGKILLQLRDDTPTIMYPNCWGTFGGAIERDETPEQAIVRELQEELGYNLRGPEYIGKTTFLGDDIYLFRKVDPHIHPDNLTVMEGQRGELFSRDQIKNLTFGFNSEEMVERYFEKYYPSQDSIS